MIVEFTAVALGGALGSMLRFGTSLLLRQWTPSPWPTLFINVLGCFCIGALSSWLVRRGTDPRWLFLFLGTGVLGGFTTFSAFGLETVELIQSGASLNAAIYVTASLILGLGAVTLGRSLT